MWREYNPNRKGRILTRGIEGGQKPMDSNLVRKIEKAKDYAEQPDRVKITQYKEQFRGDNNDHSITYEAGRWDCDCDCSYFSGRGTCSHTMAMDLMLNRMAL